MEHIHRLIELIKAYGGGVSLVITWAAIAWVYLAKRSDWQHKQFLSHVNFSLNYVLDGRLAMRTLAEVPAAEVWLNELGVKQVRQAAEGTTVDRPFVELDDAKDMEFVYRAVLNVLSEQFAETYIAQSLGVPVVTGVYCFAITMERYTDIRTLKLRVLLAREEDLETAFAPAPPGGAAIEVPNVMYAARLQTLQRMHDLHRRAGQPGVMHLGRVVLGIRN